MQRTNFRRIGFQPLSTEDKSIECNFLLPEFVFLFVDSETRLVQLVQCSMKGSVMFSLVSSKDDNVIIDVAGTLNTIDYCLNGVQKNLSGGANAITEALVLIQATVCRERHDIAGLRTQLKLMVARSKVEFAEQRYTFVSYELFNGRGYMTGSDNSLVGLSHIYTNANFIWIFRLFCDNNSGNPF